MRWKSSLSFLAAASDRPLQSCAPRSAISPIAGNNAGRSLFFGFPQADHVAFWVLHPGKRSSGKFDGRDERLAAKSGGLCQIASHVLHVDVKGGEVMRLMAQGDDVAGNSVGLGGDHRGRPFVRDFPIKQLGVKFRCFRFVLAADFKMNDWTSHVASVGQVLLPVCRVLCLDKSACRCSVRTRKKYVPFISVSKDLLQAPLPFFAELFCYSRLHC